MLESVAKYQKGCRCTLDLMPFTGAGTPFSSGLVAPWREKLYKPVHIKQLCKC